MAETGMDRPLAKRLAAVTRRYFDLGFTSFGGPGVHVVILRQRFVEKLKWIDERTFLDLFALGNALPGPGSTQLAFSIAVVTNGVLAGLWAFLLWSLPGAIGMVAIGVGISNIPDELPGPVLALFTGLNAAAVGLIALAAFQLGTAAGTDRITIALVWLSASFGICYHAPWMYPVLIAAGGIVTLLWDFKRQLWRTVRRQKKVEEAQGERVGQNQGSGIELDTLPAGRASTIDIETPVEHSSSASQDKHDTVSQGQTIMNPYPSPNASPVPARRRLPQVGGDDEHRSIRSTPSYAPSHTQTQAQAPQTPMPAAESSKLSVVSIPVAISLISGFVLLLTIPLAARAGLSNAGKEVPRVLDVSLILLPISGINAEPIGSSSATSSSPVLSSSEEGRSSFPCCETTSSFLVSPSESPRARLTPVLLARLTTHRLGQLERLPPRLLHPPGLPRTQLQLCRRTRVPRLPGLPTSRRFPRFRRYLLPWQSPQTRSTAFLRFVARQARRPIHHPRPQRCRIRSGLHGRLAALLGRVHLQLGRWVQRGGRVADALGTIDLGPLLGRGQ